MPKLFMKMFSSKTAASHSRRGTMQLKREWSWLLAALCCCALSQAEVEQNGGQRYSNLYRKHLQQMARIADANVPPCEDYFQHACGHFAAAAAGDEGDEDDEADESAAQQTHVPPFLYNHEDRMHFFEETRAHFGTPMGHMLNDLYEDCKQRTRQNAQRSQWRRMLLELDFLRANAQAYRRWPLLRYQWHELRQRGVHLDWVRLAAAFAAHGVSSFIDIFFAPGTIYVAPVEQSCATLRELSDSLQPLLQHRHAQVTQIIASEMWLLCRELQRTAAAAAAEQANVADELQLENGTLALMDEYFEHYFAILNLTAAEVGSARKIPIKMTRLALLLSVLQRTEPVVVWNYVLWHAQQQLRYADCFLLTEEFEQLLHAEYWQWHAFEAQLSREVAMATFLYHSTRFQRLRKRTLLSGEWDKFLAVRPKRKDLNVEQLIRQHAQAHLNASQLASSYVEGVPLQAGAFYANLLQLRRRKLRNSFYEPAVDVEDHNQPAYFLQQFLHFCILLLKQPLFHYFATQDYERWHAADVLYTADGFYTALDCLQRQSHSHWDEAVQAAVSVFWPPLNALHAEQVYRMHGAFLEAYRDYQFWLEGESFAFAEDFILEYFELDSRRVLFYAVAQLYCGRNDSLYRRQINRSFMNMLEFQAAFNCSAEATLNPPMKCMSGNFYSEYRIPLTTNTTNQLIELQPFRDVYSNKSKVS